MHTDVESPPSGFRAGVRAGVPVAVAGGMLAVSFGVVAEQAGVPGIAAVIMSAVVFAGSAQFAAISILAGGGTVGAAVLAAALMNSRFLPMAAAFGPSTRGGPIRRALEGQTVTDASWAMAAQRDGTFDRGLLFGTSAVQYLTWVAGTVVGVVFGGALGDPEALGLDAIYPAFFLALVIEEARGRRGIRVALVGGAIALALVPFAPPGVPVLVASVAALVGLRGGAS